MTDALTTLVIEAYRGATDVALSSRDHGPKHWRDVARMGIIQVQAGVPADPLVLFTFAALHDTQRHDEWRDPEHGPRAAEAATRLRAAGVLDYLDDDQVAQLLTALAIHNGSDGSEDVTIGACLDADRYTLWRVGVTPDVRYLSGAARGVIPTDTAERFAAYGRLLVNHNDGFDWRTLTLGALARV